MNTVYIDVDEMLQRVRGNKKTAAMLLELFLDGEELDRLKDDLEKNDYVAAETSSHGIKGMVGTLSMPKLFLSVEKLNNELKIGAPNDDTVAEYFAVLEKTLATAQNALSAFKEQI